MYKVWDIHGGIHPPENKAQSLQTSLKQAPIPESVVLPLGMHAGAPAIPCVQVGDKVKRGEKVAQPSGAFSAAIHASISGVVSAIEDRLVSHPSGNPGQAIVIQSDGLDESVSMEPITNYRETPVESLRERVREAGIAGLGGAGFPSHIKLNPISKIDTLIINGAECEPYITADACLMREFADQVIEGIKLLAYMLGEPKNILFGVEDNKPEAIQALEKAAVDSSIEIITIPTKYPSGGEKQLIQILTGEEVPSGKLPANLGIVVHNPGTAIAVLEAVTQGLPLTSRITTFVGDNMSNPGNYKIRIGSTLAELLPALGANAEQIRKVVLGGPMMGFAMPDLNTPLLKISNCVLLPSAEELPDPEPAQPCIRCGSCAEVCPAQLLPQQLFWFAQAEDHRNLQNHNLFDCIECGACSYVCPSNIPLVQYYRASKGAIKEADKERIASDRARRRFEERSERIEQETKEREAKRAARMQAAKAKQAANEQQSSNTDKNPSSNSDEDLVAAAMARVQAQSSSSSALPKQAIEERIKTLQQKVEDSDSVTNKKKLEAELADARAQLTRLEQKTQQVNAPQDAATQAIERAKQKAAQQNELSPQEKLEQSIASLDKRIAKSEDRVAQARAEEADTLAALENGLEKLLAKRTEQQAELDSLPSEKTQEAVQAEEPVDAATAAIERAKQKAAQQNALSPKEKLEQSLEALTKRIEKSNERVEQAKEEGSDTLQALENGLAKLLVKQTELQAELESISE